MLINTFDTETSLILLGVFLLVYGVAISARGL